MHTVSRLQLFNKENSPQIFSQYVSQSSCLKKNILRKKSMMENVLIKLRPCSTKSSILSKTELNRAHVRSFCRSAENSNVFTKKPSSVEEASAENSNVFTKKPPRRRLLFSEVAGLEFISCNLIKKELHHKDSCEISLPSIF